MLHVDQVQTDAGAFTMPIDIVIETAAGDDTVSVWNDEWGQDFFLTADAEPTGLLFDPDKWILRDASYVGAGVFNGASGLALSVGTNPSPHGATITYSTPSNERVKLAIYDVSGRLVRVLVDAEIPSGTRSVTWDAADRGGRRVASGVYFARLVTEEATRVRKLMIIR
jgi:hypothetical protein